MIGPTTLDDKLRIDPGGTLLSTHRRNPGCADAYMLTEFISMTPSVEPNTQPSVFIWEAALNCAYLCRDWSPAIPGTPLNVFQAAQEFLPEIEKAAKAAAVDLRKECGQLVSANEELSALWHARADEGAALAGKLAQTELDRNMAATQVVMLRAVIRKTAEVALEKQWFELAAECKSVLATTGSVPHRAIHRDRLNGLIEAAQDALDESVDAGTYPDGPCLPGTTRDKLRRAIMEIEREG